MFQLVSISGKNRGATWTVDGSGLVLGRDPECDVVLADLIASRRHCRIVLVGGEVQLEDLKSRNPVLVNGVPSRDCALRDGDEIAIGRERFFLAAVSRKEAESDEKAGLLDTASWSQVEPVSVPIDATTPPVNDRPRTIQDLVMLHETTRELSGSETLDELIAALRGRLCDRFRPQHLWIGLVHGDDTVTFCEPEGTRPAQDIAAPVEAIQVALRDGRGLLVPTTASPQGRKALSFTLISPMTAGRSKVGVLALQTAPPHGAYDEDDLMLLVLLAQSVAPLIHVVNDLEQLRLDNERLRVRAHESQTLVGESRAIRSVRGGAAQAARSSLNVLITGETGTGKELVARLIHARSSRRTLPLVVANCAAIPRELFPSVFFGHKKGAFTDASEATVGLVAQAHGGILFLDEIGDLSLENQARSLRVIETGRFRRVGAEEETDVDLRVIAATNIDLPAALKSGAFRRDLYHRLNGFEIHIPPLRKRPSDIPILAEHFFQMGREQGKRPLSGIAPEAMELLQSRSWPGNVRELRNCIEHAIAVAREDMIRPEEVADVAAVAPSEEQEEEPLSLDEAEKQHIIQVLRQCKGSVSKAAKVLRVGRSTLYRKLASHGIER